MVTIDLCFSLKGSEIPADHGYALFSAISHVIPSLHDDKTIGVHPISGMLTGGRMLHLTDGSRLVLRMNSERIQEVMHLSGKRLDIGGYTVSVGLPSPMMLRPASNLHSRIVVIKGFLEVEPFLEACRRQFATLGVTGDMTVPTRVSSAPLEHGKGNATSFIRRTIRIHDMTVVGYAVQVNGLSPQDSIRLQEAGLGGRRRFGCGIFVPLAGGRQT
ncbi:MAG: type I-MYXAN CRISPR-associated protein Cas6/Cmx6 [Nitrososphaerota archaeon]|jgi:CRISPR-associated protein Cas6|nr:type I-MYXAN CRISPR-associated protein Cas6/Cmx6 [Nitrososphaerota archaeon]